MTFSSRFGPFEIHSQIGAGTFAVVYRAYDTRTSGFVALKVLHPHLLQDADWVNRFGREGLTMAALRHDSIVPVLDTGQAESRLYIAMTLIEGTTLAGHLQQRGALSYFETLVLLHPLSNALDYVHRQQIIHRDLKPANILLDTRGVPYLTDFGVIRLLGEETVAATLSKNLVGTPQYLAPEIWEEAAASPQSDVYAFACIAFELLVGQPLFPKGSLIQVMRAHHSGPKLPQAWPKDIPSSVSDVFVRALAREPSERYPSASAFWSDLANLAVSPSSSRYGDLSPADRAFLRELDAIEPVAPPVRASPSLRRRPAEQPAITRTPRTSRPKERAKAALIISSRTMLRELTRASLERTGSPYNPYQRTGSPHNPYREAPAKVYDAESVAEGIEIGKRLSEKLGLVIFLTEYDWLKDGVRLADALRPAIPRVFLVIVRPEQTRRSSYSLDDLVDVDELSSLYDKVIDMPKPGAAWNLMVEDILTQLDLL